MGRGALIVLDTHAVIWYASGVKMRRVAMSAIESALISGGVARSAISAWEIGLLIAKNRLIVQTAPGEYVRALFSRDGITESR